MSAKHMQDSTYPNPTLDTIHKHRSIRSFDTNHVLPKDHLDIILKAGQQAATSCSGQMYSIIEISKEKREEIKALCGNQDYVAEASFFCVITVDLHRLHRIVETCEGTNQNWPMAGLMIGIFDAGLMAQNMVLAAESMGYGTCFCGSCGDKPEEMIKSLGLPPLTMPLTGLAIGIGTENPPQRPRLPTNLIHHYDAYKDYNSTALNLGIDLMDQKLQEEGYYQKYSNRDLGFGWRDHMRGKFGGKWLNIIEKRRLQMLKNQQFLD